MSEGATHAYHSVSQMMIEGATHAYHSVSQMMSEGATHAYHSVSQMMSEGTMHITVNHRCSVVPVPFILYVSDERCHD